jgi:hypothetical protein
MEGNFNSSPSNSINNKSRRDILKKITGLIAVSAIPEIANAQLGSIERFGTFTFKGFDGEVENLENIKKGLLHGLQMAENELSKNGPINCSKLPIDIYFLKSPTIGISITVAIKHKGQEYNLTPKYQISRFSMDFKNNKPVGVASFAEYVRDRLLESPNEVREICSSN